MDSPFKESYWKICAIEQETIVIWWIQIPVQRDGKWRSCVERKQGQKLSISSTFIVTCKWGSNCKWFLANLHKWIFLCLAKWLLWVKDISQILHIQGFSLEWTLLCRVKLILWLNGSLRNAYLPKCTFAKCTFAKMHHCQNAHFPKCFFARNRFLKCAWKMCLCKMSLCH